MVQVRGILPANSGAAIFLGNEEKVFIIQVETNMAQVIGNFLREAPKERPLTHDLLAHVFQGFGIEVERVVITELKNSTYFARMILKMENELGTKIVELDARPSDCLAIASAQKVPVYVSNTLFKEVEDMSDYLDQINENPDQESDNE
jgi:bifunctional DNase/RNase|tara:strand:- start:1117 stop:1560 length:444 start_codon:yes stop_codon:yes gene_type:complete